VLLGQLRLLVEIDDFEVISPGEVRVADIAHVGDRVRRGGRRATDKQR
jgi:hypothetical protein